MCLQIVHEGLVPKALPNLLMYIGYEEAVKWAALIMILSF